MGWTRLFLKDNSHGPWHYLSVLESHSHNSALGKHTVMIIYSLFQVKLHYTEKALQLIAKKAMAKNTGARGLRAILESILMEAMFEVLWHERWGLLPEMRVYFQPLWKAFTSGITAIPLGNKFQIPDIKTGNERVDAVVVDEGSVGSIESHGCGAKILRGDGAFTRYLAESELENLAVLHFWSVKTVNRRRSSLVMGYEAPNLMVSVSLKWCQQVSTSADTSGGELQENEQGIASRAASM